MNRREFIVKAPGLLALPLIIQQIGCDQPTKSNSSDNGTEDIDFTVTSSVDSGHSHTIKILYDDVENQSTANKTLTSSSTNHTHQVTISPNDYQTLKDGGTVVKTSTTDGGHSHTFSIKVPATNSTSIQDNGLY
ncbi:MAG: hypothetical protein V3U21_02955 [Thermodesulfobacteriota bacterium]